MHPETPGILSNVEKMLEIARSGLNDLINGPAEKKLAGLSNLIVFGRSVTSVLQKLRYKEERFDEWYNPYVIEMKSDDLMFYIYKLRSEILKEGKTGTRSYAIIKSLSGKDIQRLPPPPPNAKGFFMGDEFGGSGWEIDLPDGSIKKYYVSIPLDIGETGLFFSNTPKVHKGKNIEDSSIENLCTLYYNYLQDMVKSAKETFL